jgi:hypothetical protein
VLGVNFNDADKTNKFCGFASRRFSRRRWKVQRKIHFIQHSKTRLKIKLRTCGARCYGFNLFELFLFSMNLKSTKNSALNLKNSMKTNKKPNSFTAQFSAIKNHSTLQLLTFCPKKEPNKVSKISIHQRSRSSRSDFSFGSPSLRVSARLSLACVTVLIFYSSPTYHRTYLPKGVKSSNRRWLKTQADEAREDDDEGGENESLVFCAKLNFRSQIQRHEWCDGDNV